MDIEQIVAEICEIEESLQNQNTDTRKRVIREGKRLKQAQDWQKKKQAETGQTWKEWCEEQKAHQVRFPAIRSVNQYILIAKYPKAYRAGMSIKEAYKEAGRWKKNGGNPPEKEKVTIQSRLPAQLGTPIGRALNRLEKYNALDWDDVAASEGWTDDEYVGLEEDLILCRQEINVSLRKLRETRKGAEA